MKPNLHEGDLDFFEKQAKEGIKFFEEQIWKKERREAIAEARRNLKKTEKKYKTWLLNIE